MSEPTLRRRLARLLPIAVLAAGCAAFIAFGLDTSDAFAALRRNHEALTGWVAANTVLAGMVYFLLYTAVTAFSLPVASLVTLVGGFLFGWLVGGALTVVGATVGAMFLFLAARTGLRPTVEARAGSAIRRMEAGFRADAFHYLLFLRLVPLFPFWLVNIVPALLGVPLRTYALATLIGIAPGSFVFSSLGGGLGSWIEAGAQPDLAIILEPKYLLPLLGLAALALGPVAYRRLRGKRPPPGIANELTDDTGARRNGDG